jgi:UDP-N-acetylmuramyl pentapeptide synthase
MIQNAIKYIHFNENKPENHNILITNVKSKHLKVLKNNQWCYENKQDVIEDIVDKNYYILDGHYQEEGHKELNNFENTRYKEFQNNYDNQNKKLHTQLKDDTELVIINETKSLALEPSIKGKDQIDNLIENKPEDEEDINASNEDNIVNI